MDSQSGSDTILDYDNLITASSFPFTAPKNGIITIEYAFWNYRGSPEFYFFINGICRGGMHHEDDAGVGNTQEIRVNKGDTFTFSARSPYIISVKFIPFK